MKRKTKNRQLSEKLTYTGKNETPTNIHFIQYGENFFYEENPQKLLDIDTLVNDQTVSWIRVNGMNNPDLIIDLVKDFGLNILDAKDILTIQHLITVEEYDDYVFVVLPVVYYSDKNEVTLEHLSLILGKNYVISFQESNYPFFSSIQNGIKENSLKINNKKSDFLFATMLSEILNNYSDVVSQMENSLEELEDLLLDTKKYQENQMETIQEKRREMIRLRKLLIPFKDQMAKLLRVDKDLISEKEIPFYKDIYDQLLYILQNIESCREIMSTLVDIYLSNNDLKMNVTMKQLTIVATIFNPLTFLVGVWGMNFKFMPELDWRYGYLFAWGIIISCAGFVWWFLKRKHWF